VGLLTAQALAQPSQTHCGSQWSSTTSTAQHLAGALFEALAQVDLTHIPYRGGGPALNDVMGGQVPLFWIHSMFAGSVALLEIEATPAEHRDLIDLLRNFQKMTITADEEINRIIQSCKRARAQNIENLTFVPSRRFTAGPEMDDEDEDEWIEEEDPDDDHVLIYSPLNQTLTRNGVTVEIHIYKGRGSDWILEVVDAGKNSHVWDDQFKTDQQAFDEAMRALDEEPLEFMEPTSGEQMN